MTNVDQLHNSILDRDYTFSNRQTGKTRILLHQIIGEIQLGISEYILIEVQNFQTISWLKREFRDALIGQWITISRETKDKIELINENNQLVKLCFVSKGQNIWYRDYAYFELD